MPSTAERTTAARARTPPTPLHGPQYDNYQPYSSRRSTRSTAQSNPYSSSHSDPSPRASTHWHTTPPATGKRTRFARIPTQLSSPPSSPASPIRTRLAPQHHKTPGKQLSGKATNGGPALSDSDHASSSLVPSNLDPTIMLPTPSKTPKKRGAVALNSTARILSFQANNPNDVMPHPRKMKKHGRFNSMKGFDLYDEEHEAGGEQVEVFRDANARVPELDEGEDNPFVGPKRASARPQRRTRKAPTAEEDAMDEAARRDEGVVYVFRGKKIFRRFSDPETERSSTPSIDLGDAPGQRTLKRQAGAAAQRPLTRSAIKPRLLFPSEEELLAREQTANDNAIDEEATTDIEMSNTATPHTQTPTKHLSKPATTPPTTTRATRSTHTITSPTGHLQAIPGAMSEDDPEPISVGTDECFASQQQLGKRRRKSPFDAWQRTKGERKRAGEVMEEGGKRTRGAVIRSPA